MTAEQAVYHQVVGTFRATCPAEAIAEIQSAMEAIRNLPYHENVIYAAICTLGAGLTAGVPLKQIAL